MQLTYQKLGKDHPMYGKVDFLVADGMTPICYKTAEGYLPLEDGANSTVSAQPEAEVNTRPLYVLSFKINGEAEEMTFGSKKKMDKAIAQLKGKDFVSDIQTAEHQVLM